MEGDENEEVSVMGEFNQWCPEVMIKDEAGKFQYETKVVGGFKYRYEFIVNGNMVYDEE